MKKGFMTSGQENLYQRLGGQPICTLPQKLNLLQICGAYPDTMTRCAQIINDTLDVDFVDINCGCPIDLIFNKVGGQNAGRNIKCKHIYLME